MQHNPLLEEAHYRLVLLYAQTGRLEAALAQYEQCRQLLADELAVEPMPSLAALQADIRAGRLKAGQNPRHFRRRQFLIGLRPLFLWDEKANWRSGLHCLIPGWLNWPGFCRRWR